METPTVGSLNPSFQPGSSHEEEQRTRAGPLPRKRGEIGYVEEVDRQEQSRSSSPEVVLPPRHPADRDVEHGATVDATQAPASTQTPAAGTPPDHSSSISTSDAASSVDSASAAKQKGRHLLSLFKCKHKHKPPPKIGGIVLSTLVKFITQVLVFCGTIVGWVFTTRFLDEMRERGDGRLPGGASSTIFMHIVFGIASLGQILLLERRIFRIRAERYNHLHPDQLPSFRNRHTVSEDIIALSPWNRPPLPTYAAVLAQSGRGTGDVEDHIITQQPPPAYGNTRGSTFLLSGYLNENLRLQRPPSVHSASSMPERPRSYVSRDEEWEAIQDADRARRLEETLARLERSASRSSSRT